MRTIIVDDELWALEEFESEARGIAGIEILGMFKNPLEALKFAQSNQVDFALLDIEMTEMTGIELGKRLKAINPAIVIIYVTSYSSYLKEAFFDVKADYYIQKPYNSEDINGVFERASKLSQKPKKRVRFVTFGRFDMFIDGVVVKISNAKAKELLALCVDREGGTVTMEEAIDKLWENRQYDDRVKRLYRRAIIDLNAIFLDYRATDVFTSGRAVCSINRSAVDCDCYDYLAGLGNCGYHQNYMMDYSWAEEKNAYLLFGKEAP